MRSIRDFNDEDLDKQIENARVDMDNTEYGTGDYNSAYSELIVAQKEKERREYNKGLKNRNLTVELHDKEWDELEELASKYCLTSSKLIEYFIRDLTWNREQGSDEHDLARRWYDRSYHNHEHKK